MSVLVTRVYNVGGYVAEKCQNLSLSDPCWPLLTGYSIVTWGIQL